MKLLGSSYLHCDVNSVVAACSDNVGYVVLGWTRSTQHNITYTITTCCHNTVYITT